MTEKALFKSCYEPTDRRTKQVRVDALKNWAYCGLIYKVYDKIASSFYFCC